VDGHSNGNSNGATNGSATQGSKNKTRHELVQGEIVALSAYSVDVVEADAKGGYGSSASGNGSTIARTIPFDYCIYALGASLPAPCDVWGGVTAGRGSKLGGIRWMEGQGEVLAGTQRILIVGGGALGIREYRRSIQ
jgi:pyruvate/2-oxoglutarate dehydrogenase complex dihydrolipoamide dehydrogenase (E3) component